MATPSTSPTASRWLPLAVLVVALATSAAVAVGPIVSTETCSTDGFGRTTCAGGSEALVANEGASVLVVLAVPVLVALVGAVRPTPRTAATVAALLLAGCLLAGFSIGLFYVPTALVALAAAAAARSRT